MEHETWIPAQGRDDSLFGLCKCHSSLGELSGGRYGAEIVPFDRAGVPAQDMLRLMQMVVIPFGTVQISRVAAQDAEFSAVDLAGLNPDMATLKTTLAVYRLYP